MRKITERYGDATKAEAEAKYYGQKESLKDAAAKPEELTRIKTEMVSQYLQQAGVTIEGLTPYIVRQLPKVEFETYEQFRTQIAKSLSAESGVIQRALGDLIKDSPNATATTLEKGYISKFITENRLFVRFGKDNIDKAADAIARQLHIVFGSKGEPMAFMDMKTDELVQITPQNPDTLNDTIKNIVQSQQGRLGDYTEEMADLTGAQEKQFGALREGTFRFGFGVEKVDELADLQKHPELSAMIENGAKYREFIMAQPATEQLTELAKALPKTTTDTDLKQAVESIASLTPARISANPALREEKVGGALGAIIALIRALIGKGDTVGLNEAKAGLDAGRNPDTDLKEVKKGYTEILGTKKPKIDEALAAYLDPDNTEIFKMEKQTQEAQELIDRYKSPRKEALSTYLSENLGGATVTKVELADNKYSVLLQKDKVNVRVHIYRGADESQSLVVRKIGDNDWFNLEADGGKDKLAALLAPPAAPAPKPSEPAEKVEKSTDYSAWLNGLVETTDIGSTKSRLGEIVDMVKVTGKPLWAEAEGENKAQKQEFLDRARVAFIVKNLASYKDTLEREREPTNVREIKQALVRTTSNYQLIAEIIKSKAGNEYYLINEKTGTLRPLKSTDEADQVYISTIRGKAGVIQDGIYKAEGEDGAFKDAPQTLAKVKQFKASFGEVKT